MRSNYLTHRLKEQIEALKGGVTTAANHLGKSRNTIYNWIEKGNAPLDQVGKLSEIGVDIYYIVTGLTMHELNKIAGYSITDMVSENAKQYQGSGTETRTPGSAIQNRHLNLEDRLSLIIEDYIRDDTLTMITTKLDQTLNEEGISLDDEKKNHLIAAAQKAYDQLMAAGRTEKFNALLKTLIAATLAERNN
ncbi:hypothetical protein MNBD_GAMMA05-2115 [hydrothermal vent metagenome]|uniref:Bacteriophage CI repressor N-terminal domain-containing protein n=1 Tax=hydrothermal vent metagenome TaxID=652676 RepID=A0A3B0XHT8_9ZZZZ